MDLYERIKKVAKEKGYSINRLEKDAGFPRSYIGKFKTITPSIDKIQKIAEILGVSVDYLMNGEEPKEESYYLDKDAAEIANFLHKNPEYRVLFDSSRKVKPEHIALIKELMDKFSE